MNTTTIEDAKQAKVSLCSVIKNAIEQFEQDTGMQVESVEVSKYTITTHHENTPLYTRVEINVSL